jgi:hypothetical protein
MKVTYCDICHKEAGNKYIDLRIKINTTCYEWELCQKCYDRFDELTSWLFVNYGKPFELKNVTEGYD